MEEKQFASFLTCEERVLTGNTNKEYTGSMAKKKKKQKKRKNHIRTGKLPKDEKTQILLMPPDDNSAERENFEDEDLDEETGEMYLHKEDIRLLYNALKAYKPVREENNLHGVLLEEFEELLVVDYGEKLPGFEFMDDEEN